MTRKPLPAPDVLRKLLRIDYETGHLFWQARERECFANEALWRSFNNQYAGKRAMHSVDSNGYLRGFINGVPYSAHRVAFAIHHGFVPDEIDHIDGDKENNRIENLRSVSAAEDSKNKGITRKNKSGICGVHWNEIDKKWVANITSNYRRFFLGAFNDINDARNARKAAERELGFHENHGRRVAR